MATSESDDASKYFRPRDRNYSDFRCTARIGLRGLGQPRSTCQMVGTERIYDHNSEDRREGGDVWSFVMHGPRKWLR